MDPFKASNLGQARVPCALCFLRLVFPRGPPGCSFCFCRRLEATCQSPAEPHRCRVGKCSAWGRLDEALALADVTSAAPRDEVPEKGAVAGSTTEPLPKPKRLGGSWAMLGPM